MTEFTQFPWLKNVLVICSGTVLVLAMLILAEFCGVELGEAIIGIAGVVIGGLFGVSGTLLEMYKERFKRGDEAEE